MEFLNQPKLSSVYTLEKNELCDLHDQLLNFGEFETAGVDFETLAKSRGTETFVEMPKEFYVAETVTAKTSGKRRKEKKLLSLGEKASLSSSAIK